MTLSLPRAISGAGSLITISAAKLGAATINVGDVAVASGRLRVDSETDDALVWLNDSFEGPVRRWVSALKPGIYRLKVVAADRAPSRRRLKSAATLQL